MSWFENLHAFLQMLIVLFFSIIVILFMVGTYKLAIKSLETTEQSQTQNSATVRTGVKLPAEIKIKSGDSVFIFEFYADSVSIGNETKALR